MAGKAKVAKEESMDKKLRIPIINDVAADVKLVKYELHKSNIKFTLNRIEKEEAFLKELKTLT